MILTLLFTILSAIYDNGKRFVDHKPRFIFRAIVVALISYFEQGSFIFNFLLNTAIFYAAFDYALNMLEGRKWNYIGSTSTIDKLWLKYGGTTTQLIFKIILVLTIIYLTKIY
jgi:hypothetical protein